MILYYALGGGLGHVSRSIAILSAMPKEIQKEFLLVVSSEFAQMTSAHIPCAFEIVPRSVMTARRDYYGFLNYCIKRYKVAAIVMDTFPQGLVHELATVAVDLPRLLIARYLNIDAYDSANCAATNEKEVPQPSAALAVEGLSAAYLARLKKHADISAIDSPIILSATDFSNTASGEYTKRDPEWLVVNSGNADELASLIGFAKELMIQGGDKNPQPSVLSPEHGVYPAWTVMQNYKNVVSGAGYNMAAIGQVNTGATHHYKPFKRKYDDQFIRLERIKSGSWLTGRADGAQKAGTWVTDTLNTLL